ncbi:hypothetical protein Tco_1264238 [Tanacetum coccineum]
MSNTLNAYSAATQFYTYYAFASGKKTPKPKYVRKKAEPDTSPKHKHVQATKGDGVDTQSKVPNEKQQKSSGTDEGTVTILGVLDVPIYESESKKESWGDSEDEDRDFENNSVDLSDEGDDNNDGDDDEANDDDKQEGDDTNDDDEETDTHKTKSDIIKIPILDQSTIKFYEEEENINDEETMYDDEEMMYDDEDDEVTKELYEDVNVNLGNEDTEMTNVDQGATDQQNVSQQSGFTQEEEDAHVTLTPVLNTQRSGGLQQSSFVSSDFRHKLLNLDNPSPADNEIASLMVTTTHHATVILEITSSFTTTNPPPPPFINPLSQ